MKLKLKHLALAVALVAAGSANATIDNGAGGNGELFFNIWDANGSYTRDLNVSIDAFQTTLGQAGNIDLSFAADSTYTSFLAGVADTSLLKWNIMATDVSGARRVLSTYSVLPGTTKTNDVIRTVAGAVGTYVNNVNTALGASDSVAVNSASAAWAGKSAFSDNVGGLLNYSDAGTLANNSAATGLGFMRIDAAATGISSSTYNPYTDNATAVNAYVGADNTLHIAAAAPVPEPEAIAMVLAGFGVMGSIVRRRRKTV